MGLYVIRDSQDGRYSFTLHADNGQVILRSEAYPTKPAALDGVAACKEHAANDAHYLRHPPAANEQSFFTLQTRSHEVIGNSEMYVSEAGREVGISSCKRHGPTAPTRDLTKPGAARR